MIKNRIGELESGQQHDEPAPSPKAEAKRGWTRSGVNFLLDTALLLAFTAILCIAAIIRFVFPPASMLPAGGCGVGLWNNGTIACLSPSPCLRRPFYCM